MVRSRAALFAEASQLRSLVTLNAKLRAEQEQLYAEAPQPPPPSSDESRLGADNLWLRAEYARQCAVVARARAE